ncbi:hypothetical protein CKO27_21830 [Thiocystis violacea]|nr:hypothetical protein [Thiocystis violacea]
MTTLYPKPSQAVGARLVDLWLLIREQSLESRHSPERDLPMQEAGNALSVLPLVSILIPIKDRRQRRRRARVFPAFVGVAKFQRWFGSLGLPRALSIG